MTGHIIDKENVLNALGKINGLLEQTVEVMNRIKKDEPFDISVSERLSKSLTDLEKLSLAVFRCAEYSESETLARDYMTIQFAKVLNAKAFLKGYATAKGLNDISQLFDKETLIENSSDSMWEWAVKDEQKTSDCAEKDAVEKTREWYLSMSHEELFYERTSIYQRENLILSKAEELESALN